METQQHRGSILNRKCTHCVRADGLERVDLAEHEADQVDLVNKIDQDGSAADLPPPIKIKIARRLELVVHNRGCYRPPDEPITNGLTHTLDGSIMATMMADQQRHITCLSYFTHQECGLDQVRHRLFDQYCNTSFNAGERDRYMLCVRHGDNYAVERLIFQHFSVVSVGWNALSAGEIQSRRRGIGDCDQRRLRRLSNNLPMCLADRAEANDANT